MIRFDHLVIAVRDLGAAMTMFQDRLGFSVSAGGRHEGFGTHNALVRFGLDYLELIAVEDEAVALQSSRGSLVEYLRTHECGLVAFALATDDLDALAAAYGEAGLGAVGPFAMTRLRPDGATLSWRLLVPGGDPYRRPWPFFIQWDLADSARLRLERAGDHANRVTAVSAINVSAQEISAAGRWYESLGERAGDHDYQVQGCAIRLTSALEDGPAVVTLRTDDLEQTRRVLESRGTCVESGQEGDLVLRSGPLAGAIRFESSPLGSGSS